MKKIIDAAQVQQALQLTNKLTPLYYIPKGHI